MFFQRITYVYIALLLTVFLLGFPLEGADGGYSVIGVFKRTWFLVICGGFVLTMAVLRSMFAIISITTAEDNFRERVKKIPLAGKLILGFLLTTVVSAVFSPYPGTFLGNFRREGVLTIGIYVLVFFLLIYYFHPKKWMMYLLGVVMVPVSMIALVQLTGANPFMLYPDGLNYYGAGVYYSGEFLSTIGNAGLLGSILVLAIGIMIMAFIKFESEERWFLIFPLFFTLMLVFSMGIDAAFVAVLAGTVLILPVAVTSRVTLANTLMVFAVMAAAFTTSRMIIFQNGPIIIVPVRVLYLATIVILILAALAVVRTELFDRISAKWYRGIAIMAVIGGAGMVFVFLWTYSGVPGGVIYEASQMLRGNFDDAFGTSRIFIWRNILERITWKNLLLGTGPDTLGYWDIPIFERVDEYGRYFSSRVDAAHNEMLHILATGGLLSLAAYLGALVVAAIEWFKQSNNALSAIAGAGVLFYVIQAFFGISQFIAAPFFWTCFGMLVYAQMRMDDRLLKELKFEQENTP